MENKTKNRIKNFWRWILSIFKKPKEIDIELNCLTSGRFKLIQIFLFLKWFGDKKPHTILEQQMLHFTKYRINIPDILRYCMVDCNLIVACEDDFMRLPFHKRKIIITEKGDKFYRELAILFGGDKEYFTFFDRDPYNERFFENKYITEKMKFKGVSKDGFIEKDVEGYTIN